MGEYSIPPTNLCSEDKADHNSKVSDNTALVFTPDDMITPEDEALYGPNTEDFTLTTDIDVKPHHVSPPISKKKNAKFCECSKCFQLIRTQKQRSHESKTHEFKCFHNRCSRSFLNQRDLDKHVFRDHSLRLDQEKYNACTACGELYTKDEEKSFLNHRKYAKHTVPCSHCGDVFKDEEMFEFHVFVQHSQETDLKCSQCGLRFVSSDHGRLKRHEEIPHQKFSNGIITKDEYNPVSEDSYDLVANTTIELDSISQTIYQYLTFKADPVRLWPESFLM